MNHQSLIERLNPKQREAYDHIRGPLIVMAPAGTGKTDVIALRAYHAFTQGIPADQMLLMTFTNRAARSMSKRIAEVMGEGAEQMKITTFHGLCGYILREEAQNLSFPRDFIIVDQEDAKLLLREVLGERKLNRGLYYREEGFLMDFLRLAREYPFLHETKLEIREYFFQLLKERNMMSSFSWFGEEISRVFHGYRKKLREYGLMDFTSLVVGVLQAFQTPSIKERWAQRYQWIELDEIQDTNRIEYEIIKVLYEKHGNIGIFGDIHQTIYQWRGSIPFEILQNFKLNNPGYVEVRFEENYRSTKTILSAAEDFLAYRGKSKQTAEQDDENEQENTQPKEENTSRIKVRSFKTIDEESKYIAKKIQDRVTKGTSYSDQAVLVRTNKEATLLGRQLEERGIPVFLMEKTRFFSREEIKNALAYLRLLANPSDVLSLKRIHPAGTEGFLKEQKKYGLGIESLLDIQSYHDNDPYEGLMKAYQKDDIIVFDVETTGLDVKSDQVIQIAALRGGKSGIVEKLERFLAISEKVGDSYKIHRISDDYLEEHGIEPKQAFADFVNFVGDSILLGHNVGYDRAIMTEHMGRLGMACPFADERMADSLALSRRLYPGLNSYRLESLFQQLGLHHRPTHNAMDDVIATFQLVDIMVKKMAEETTERKKLFASYENGFYPLARNLEVLRELSREKRPQDLLHEALIRSGLLMKYQEKEIELQKLRELYRIFREYDDETLPALESLTTLMEIASLGNDTDRLLRQKDQVPVITVHQSKGLEFDTVYISSATDDSFPSSFSTEEDPLKEERRLFYVAITRPKEELFITYHVGEKNEYLPSRFIHQIPMKYIDYR